MKYGVELLKINKINGLKIKPLSRTISDHLRMKITLMSLNSN